MSNLRDIRRRVKSVKSSAQVTRAMQMVASSKMRRAQQAALESRPYAHLLQRMMNQALAHAGELRHPLREMREVRKRAIILIGPDKGLCGALISNLIREAVAFDKATTCYIAAGKKGALAVGRLQRQLLAEFKINEKPTFEDARLIAAFAQELFLKNEVQQVDVLFTEYVNTLSQRPRLCPFLPVGNAAHLSAPRSFSPVMALAPEVDVNLHGASEFLFEPSADALFAQLLPHALNFELYQTMLEARASEYSSRMVAMKNATDNAQELIRDLTLTANKMRQASITNELLEITAATVAAS